MKSRPKNAQEINQARTTDKYMKIARKGIDKCPYKPTHQGTSEDKGMGNMGKNNNPGMKY